MPHLPPLVPMQVCHEKGSLGKGTFIPLLPGKPLAVLCTLDLCQLYSCCKSKEKNGEGLGKETGIGS